MNSNAIESLLEQLVSTNEKMLSELVEVKSDISEIREELNWVGEQTLAKVIYDHVSETSIKLGEIEGLLSNIDINTAG
jgi:hypothetical protein